MAIHRRIKPLPPPPPPPPPPKPKPPKPKPEPPKPPVVPVHPKAAEYQRLGVQNRNVVERIPAARPPEPTRVVAPPPPQQSKPTVQAVLFRSPEPKLTIIPAVVEQPPPPTTVAETQAQLRNLPVPDGRDVPGIQMYNQHRAEIAEAGIANSRPPVIADFNGPNNATRSSEYRDAKNFYDQSITQLRATAVTARTRPTELPLTPPQAVERIRQIPVPDPRDPAALDQYIRQTQTIAQSSLAIAQPPQPADFSHLPPATANTEYNNSVQAYYQAKAELEPTAAGISYVRYDRTVDYMFGEMKGNLNSPEFQFIRRNLDSFTNPPPGSDPSEFKNAALAMFAWQVRSGGEWDHKPILENMLGLVTTTDRNLPIDQGFPLRGDTQHEVDYDIWSNIHYGYVGRAAGFNGAGLQEAAALNIPGLTGGNDPVDVVTTQIGIDLWDKYGANLTREQFEGEVRTRLPQIIAAQETPEYKAKNPNFHHVDDINQTNRR